MVFSHREMNEKEVFDPFRKRRNKRQTNEREEYKIDVRYQNRTEITLDCEEKNAIKGYFILKYIEPIFLENRTTKVGRNPLSKFKIS